MGEFVIRIDGRMVERAIYWIIIIVLAALLVWCYLDRPDCRMQAEGNGSLTGNSVADGSDELGSEVEIIDTGDPTDELGDPADAPAESCDDGIQNQDETDVDCGGVCDGCDEGDSCERDRDCADGTCESDVCESEPELSGRIEISVTDVATKAADGTGALKVESFKVKVTNGKSDNIFLEVEGYAQTLSGVDLNQFTDTRTAYIGPVDLGKVSPGETKTITVDEAGTYVVTQTGYDTGEDFNFVVEIYDDGEKIDQITKKVRG